MNNKVLQTTTKKYIRAISGLNKTSTYFEFLDTRTHPPPVSAEITPLYDNQPIGWNIEFGPFDL